MSRKLGNILMILGAVLILSALSLFLKNQYEQSSAEKSVEAVMPQLRQAIYANVEETAGITGEDLTIPMETVPVPAEMTEVEIDGYAYIGFLSIPTLNLELPVMSQWDYVRLKISPCRYFGTTIEDNMVIAGHNYNRHFRPIHSLSEGDSVIFTDMDGEVIFYEVAALDILAPTATEEVTAGDFDLTLFTCTYGGKSRRAVYCNRVAE